MTLEGKSAGRQILCLGGPLHGRTSAFGGADGRMELPGAGGSYIRCCVGINAKSYSLWVHDSMNVNDESTLNAAVALISQLNPGERKDDF